MKILLDMNLSPALVQKLSSLTHTLQFTGLRSETLAPPIERSWPGLLRMGTPS